MVNHNLAWGHLFLKRGTSLSNTYLHDLKAQSKPFTRWVSSLSVWLGVRLILIAALPSSANGYSTMFTNMSELIFMYCSTSRP